MSFSVFKKTRLTKSGARFFASSMQKAVRKYFSVFAFRVTYPAFVFNESLFKSVKSEQITF